jgi:hypothetical protein
MLSMIHATLRTQAMTFASGNRSSRGGPLCAQHAIGVEDDFLLGLVGIEILEQSARQSLPLFAADHRAELASALNWFSIPENRVPTGLVMPA